MPEMTIAALADALGAKVEGDDTLTVAHPVHPDEADKAHTIAVATSPEFVAKLDGARAAILAEGADWRALGLEAAILVRRPRYALAQVTAAMAKPPAIAPGVHPSAVIEGGAALGDDIAVGPFTHIAAGASLGAGARIFGHVTIGAGAHIGEGALIHPGVRIGAGVTIGDRAILHSNAVIGADGFSFVTPEPGAVEKAKAGGGGTAEAGDGALVRIHSLGAVTLGDDVEVGACTTVDRGTLTDTRIGSGTKLDNQVQVGHNVQVGGGCMLCAQVGIAGSAQIGDRVVLGGKAGVADHVKIGSDVLVAAASAVAGNVPPRSIMMGVPAMRRDETLKMVMAQRRLPRLIETVEALKKRLEGKDG